MGNCFSSSPSSTTSESEKQPPSYKRSTTTTTKPTPKNKTRPNKSQGRALGENLDKDEQRLREEDARKAAGQAAQKRLEDLRLKNGKLGQKLEREKVKSKQETLREILQLKRNDNDALVYD